MSESIYDIPVTTIKGEATTLAEYKNKVMVIVNVASKCGLTPQYKELESIYRNFKDQGLVILGFPCNQFMGQEPGSSSEIAEFCSLTYDVTFPLFNKIDVNGSGTHPLYKLLKKQLPGLLGTKDIKWNFTKFLVNTDGTPYKRFGPQETPDKMIADIKELLAKN